jgi:hypothetical protein
MKVKELIELLKTKNQDADVEVRDECGSWQEVKEDYIYMTQGNDNQLNIDG